MGPERRKQYGLDSNRELFNPAVNAKVAHSMSRDGKSWTPWATYTNGAYRKYLGVARRAARRADRQPEQGKGGRDGFAAPVTSAAITICNPR